MPIKITKIQALNILLCLLTAVFVFHVFVITGIIPYEIVWAGKLKSADEMYVFEVVSILINLVLLATLLFKKKQIRYKTDGSKIMDGILWFFIVVFALNTIGNLMAKTDFERYVFTPLTLVFAILIWIIVRKHNATRDGF